MQTKLACLIGVFLAPFCLQARVGESLKQSEERYGAGQELQDAETFILKNARNLVYHHGDWIITAAYLNGVTARIRYEKTGTQQPRAQLDKEDMAEILEAEDAGAWNVFNEATQKPGKAYAGATHPPPVLRSASGLTARYQVFKVTVEREDALRHEKGLTPQQKRLPAQKRVAL